jgi:predicted metal-dependent phosphoesterase TrpH
VAAEPPEVFERIHAAGGIASLAHPVQMKRDDRIPEYAAAGLDALEVYHADHDPAATAHYLAVAADLHLAVTGGSDYHGDSEHGGARPGKVSLPREHYERLLALRPTRRASASGSLTSS